MTRCFLVAVDFSKGEDGNDNAVLIVGEKKNKVDVNIINAFQGEEAEELYRKLIAKKEKKDDI